MAQGFQGDNGDLGKRASQNRRADLRTVDRRDEDNRWPAEAPSADVARVVLKVDESITLKRTAGAAWLTAHGDAVPSLPVRPTHMELAVIIALAETYGAALYKDARHVFVLDFIADHGAVELVRRVMYGAQIEPDDSASGIAPENTRLADVLRDARVAFEFLCATWPEVFLAQTHAVLAGMGVRVRPPDADPMPPSASEGDAEDGKDDADEPDEGEAGGHG
ncbi:hypothetical protein P9281_01425 [Caballeronia sp. LP003]|uniref:hypothetical protein n=1 Tax=Caballeronia sp. LP003 TaxID=3038551 RepID=UPI00285E46D0|nr:hypothetical protein [Caballeronia sp. LP003]MDR5785224.1 hypothetical protein [Caballeronia sp. LP003]